MKRPSILIASPVNKPPVIVEYFLKSLTRLVSTQWDVSYCFVDDNEDVASSQLLLEFCAGHRNATILGVPDLAENQSWEKGEHVWTMRKIDKVATVKNHMIQHFIDHSQFTHLFFVDADLVLHPNTLSALLQSERDIVSNIFWTQWNEGAQPLPQVWQKDFYTLYDAHMLLPKSPEQINAETDAFLTMLRQPGVYRVGGLGACTLIRRQVLEAGVNFSPLYNVSFWGEDRSFCIRAVAHDFELFVDTHYPAFHIYRLEELVNLSGWLADNHLPAFD